MSKNSTQLPESGFVRLNTVLTMFPVSRSTWYQGMQDGRFPKPVKLSERINGYRVQDIRALLKDKGGAA